MDIRRDPLLELLVTAKNMILNNYLCLNVVIKPIIFTIVQCGQWGHLQQCTNHVHALYIKPAGVHNTIIDIHKRITAAKIRQMSDMFYVFKQFCYKQCIAFQVS